MRIEVICTGDEVLTGKIVNTNFSYISQKLEDFGLAVTWETTVGDDREDWLLAKAGKQTAIYLKRFHTYGIGESHADALLSGVEALAQGGGVKLGFRAHYPQLETKLAVRGADMDEVRSKLAPVEEAVRKRLGNFILAEDDARLEGVVLGALRAR